MFPHPWGILMVAEIKTPCWSWLCIHQTLLQPLTDGSSLLLPTKQISFAPGRSSVLQAAGARASTGAAPRVSFRVAVTRSPCAVRAAWPCEPGVPEPGAAALLALRFHSRLPSAEER